MSMLSLPRSVTLLAVTVWAAIACAMVAAPAQAQKPGTPGRYDYQVLALSWSPHYCATKGASASPLQCGAGQNYGFVVHGLWPQYQNGGYPANCGTTAEIPAKVVSATLPIMPDEALIQHEWQEHGSCSGLSPDLYFADIQAVVEQLRMPEDLRQPVSGLSMDPRDVAAGLLSANPNLTPESLVVMCEKNQVTEVRICVDDELQPRACGLGVVTNCSARARLTVR